MRITTIAIGAAIVAAAAMSACASRGVVPSQSFASSNGTTAMLAAKATPTPTACEKTSPPMYYFAGNCVAFTLKETATTTVFLGKYKPYDGIKITTVFSKNSGGPAGGIKAVMGDATGKGDITGKVGGKAFKLYGDGNDCFYRGKLGPCRGKSFLYAELINNSGSTIKPVDTPKFTIVDTNGFPGKKCFPAEYQKGGWVPEDNLFAAPKGNTLELPSVANDGSLYYLPHAQFIVAGVCE
ncbi:MAG TPA: hypothetical protein VGF98_15370 [Candidatus Tumulicola sp.]|jgi:hypothetical protein